MSFYEERVLPHIITKLCSSSPNQKQRQKIVPLAEGRVLEIGFGSGLNVPFYDTSKVEKIWGLEPSAGMRAKAKPLVDASSLEIEFIDLPGEEIPLDTNSADTVLVTYTLCTIPDTIAALEGVRRVLKPGGRLLYCEHGQAPDENVRRWQNRINPSWRKVAGGCNMNRDIPAVLEAGGFQVQTDERMYIPGVRVLSYNYWGSATPVN
jgi:ubiquinone/menaquinone biosynthesis C-methylase UbiE